MSHDQKAQCVEVEGSFCQTFSAEMPLRNFKTFLDFQFNSKIMMLSHRKISRIEWNNHYLPETHPNSSTQVWTPVILFAKFKTPIVKEFLLSFLLISSAKVLFSFPYQSSKVACASQHFLPLRYIPQWHSINVQTHVRPSTQ